MGYGLYGFNYKLMRAHRAAFIIFNGAIPQDKWVLHSCDNRICVNPDHLRLGTRSENVADMISRKRQAVGENHGNSRFTRDEVLQYRKEYDGKRGSITRLANKYQMDPDVMRKILRRLRWTHL